MCVEMFEMEIVEKKGISSAVGNSSPFWTNLPFHEFYAPQTKILEGGTKDEIRIFAALFNGS
jgi:hypothetical protein